MRSLSRTSIRGNSPAKPKLLVAIGWVFPTACLSLAASGCAAGEHGPATEGTGKDLESLVDEQVLENISQLESGLVGPDLRHEGRIWFTPDLVTTFLAAKDGSGMTFTLGDARDFAALESPPPVGEGAPLWDFLEEHGVEHTHVFTSESGLDIVLFDAPSQAETGVGKSTEALFGPQSCPMTLFEQSCDPGNQLRYQGSVVSGLNETDRTTNLSLSQPNVESSTIAVCSEVGGTRLQVTTSNPAWGTAPAGTGAGGLTINEGYVGVWANYGGWRERRFCAQKVLGVCVDHDYRIQFQDFDVAFSVTKLNVVSEYSFCSNFFTKADEVNQDSCGPFWCPVIGTSW
jgi:hypothetical protein